MKQLSVGIIGLGIGEQHILGFQAGGARVTALCDIDPVRRSWAQAKYPECVIYESAETLIEDAQVDVVSIASYDQYHASQVVLALDNGAHVFSEKPLCLTQKELSEIHSALIRNPNSRLSTNTILRMSERFRDIRKRITQGELGRIYHVEADYNYGRLSKILRGWRGKIKNYSVMLGGGIHMIDLLIWMVDSPVIEVSAIGNKVCSAGSTFDTPDMVIAWLRFADGTIGKVGANFGCVHPHFHTISLFGTKGTFLNQINGASIIPSRDPSAPVKPITSAYPGVAKGDLIPSFIEAIHGRGSPVVDEDAVFASVSTALAIDRSLETGKPEPVQTYSFS